MKFVTVRSGLHWSPGIVPVVHLQDLNFLINLLKPMAWLCMEMTSDWS